MSKRNDPPNLRTLLNPKNWGAKDYSKYKSFSKAYEKAKKAGEKRFIWNGKAYNTKYAGTPRQEVGAYGVNGEKVDKDQVPIKVNNYPYLSNPYLPSHIEAEFYDPSGKDDSAWINYSKRGNKTVNTPDDKNKGKSTYVYNADKERFIDSFSDLSGEKNNKYNLFFNNCADKVCEAFNIKNKGITTPNATLKKIKSKYPTLDVTGRTYIDYYDLYNKLSKSDPDKILENSDHILGLSRSPDLKKIIFPDGKSLSNMLVTTVQSALAKEFPTSMKHSLKKSGYNKPKQPSSFDGVYGKGTKEALENWRKENSTGEKKYNKGGFLDNIAPLLDIAGGAIGVPGVGSAVSGIAGMFKQPEQQPAAKLSANTMMKMGGRLKEYNGPSHEQGGIKVDANGNPSINAVAEVEGGETKMKNPDLSTYVFSDSLIDPDTGRTFAEQSKRIEKRMKGDDDISRKARMKLLMKLQEKNEKAKPTEVKDLMKFDNGGFLPEIDPIEMIPYGSEIEEAKRSREGFTASPTISSGLPKSPLTDLGETPNISFGNTPQESTKNNLNLNTVAGGLKGISLLGSMRDALRKPEQERLQMPDYSAGDEAYQNLATDYAPMLQELNQQTSKGQQMLDEQVQGAGQRMARLNSLYGRAGRESGKLRLQQDQYNNQLQLQRAAREDQKAIGNSQERIRQQTVQSQNDATARLAGRKLMQDLSQVGSTLNKLQYAKDMMKNQNELAQKAMKWQLDILGNKYMNFGLTPDAYERIQSGNAGPMDLIMLNMATNKAQKQGN